MEPPSFLLNFFRGKGCKKGSNLANREGWMGERDAGTDGWMDGWMNGGMEEELMVGGKEVRAGRQAKLMYR